MLYKKTLDEVAHLATGSMLDRKGENVELYRSINKKKTGQYFGSDETKESEFDVVIFGYNHAKHSVYVKYPDNDFYIEMYGGTGSSHGTITSCNIRNIMKEKLQPFVYEGVLRMHNETILKHDEYAVYKFGTTDFNFLERVALLNNKSYGDKSYGSDYIDLMLTKSFIPIPEERVLAYTYITNDNKFVIVDQSAYNFQYETMRCFYGDLKSGIKIGEIKNFGRYKDGGTTLFDFILDGVTYKFFSPANLFRDSDKHPTWNDEVMTEMPKDAVSLLINNLGITLAAEVKE